MDPDHPKPGDAVADEVLDLLKSWQRHLRADPDISDGTIKIYGTSIRAFAEYLRERDDAPGDITGVTRRPHIEDWIIGFREAGRASWTILTRYSNLRTFMYWLVSEGEIPANPMKGMREPKVTEQPVSVISVDELVRLLKVCSGSGFYERRDEALIRSYFDSGMRLSESSGLLLTDVDMEQQVFWVRGKGGRMRACPFGTNTARAMDRYLRARRKHPKKNETERLWLGRKGPLTSEGVRQMLNRRVEQAGIGHKRPHQLRHTAAHQLRLAGMSDRDMKRIFGWRSNRMLERYGESAADESARESHRRLSFGDQI